MVRRYGRQYAAQKSQPAATQSLQASISVSACHFGRRKELQLLVMTADEMRTKVPSFQWTQMMTSGLERQEVRALAHCLRQPGVPATAAPFVELLRTRIATFAQQLLTADLAGGAQLHEQQCRNPASAVPPPPHAGSRDGSLWLGRV